MTHEADPARRAPHGEPMDDARPESATRHEASSGGLRAAAGPLHESEATLGAVLEALPVGVIIADAAGRVVRDNAANRALWGIPPDTASWHQYGEWVGWRAQTGERIQAHEWAMARALLAGETVRGELVECQPFDGGPHRFFLNSAAPVRDAAGRVIGGVVAELEVTEQRAAAEALAASEAALRETAERYRLAARATNDAIWDWRMDDGHVVWNEALGMLFGHAERETSAQWWLDHIHPDDRARVEHDIHAVIDGDGSKWSAEYRFVRADGAYADVMDRGFVLRDEAGRAVRMIGAMLDLTERKQIERALREADARKNEFLATLAHELRNPLAPVLNAARILGHAQALDATGQTAVEMIERQARHMKRLVDDLLEVSRITRGAIELRPEPLPLEQAIRDAVEAVRPALQAKRQRLQVMLPDEEQQLQADPVRITQVLHNLLSNASKYTPAGGSIRVQARREPTAVEIRVIDDGIGIDLDKLESVFELFVQAQPGVGEHQGGLGIGLALVRRLVELHGGTVHAESAGPGTGTTVVLRLPCVAGEQAAGATPAQPASPKSGPRSPPAD